MAASMIKCRIWSPKSISLVPRRYRKSTYNSYYVAIPQMPKDTPKDNELLRYNEHPDFEKFHPYKIMSASAKAAITYDMELTKLVDKVEAERESGNEPTFDEIHKKNEELTVPVEYVKRSVEVMASLGGNLGTCGAALNETVNRRIDRARDDITTQDIYEMYKKIDSSKLDAAQKRVWDGFMVTGEARGYNLAKKKRDMLLNYATKLSEEEENFAINVISCYRHYKPKLYNAKMVSRLPMRLQREVALNPMNPSRGPWHLRLDSPIYDTFMSFCDDRTERKHAWEHKLGVCSAEFFSQSVSNSILVGEILSRRQDIALLYGYKNFADFEHRGDLRMIGSTENVEDMIQLFKDEYHQAQKIELAELQKFAEGQGFNGPLKMFDIDYYQRLQYDTLFKLDDNDLVEYFPYEHVRDKMFSLFEKLFQLRIEECTREVKIWDPSIKFYKLYEADGEEELGGFYIDAFHRKGRRMEFNTIQGRLRHDAMGLKPYVFQFYNIRSGLEEHSAYMNINEIEDMFGMFGRCLQDLLPRAPYSALSGLSSIEVDVRSVVARLFARMATNPHVLKYLARHGRTSEVPDDSSLETVLDGRKHMFATQVMKDVFASALDREFHGTEYIEEWLDVYHEVYNDYNPIAFEPKIDRAPCSDIGLFGKGGTPTLMYANLYAEVVASELYQQFEKIGFEDLNELEPEGKRFKEAFLCNSGVMPYKEVFRRYVGRDPSPHTFVNENKQFIPEFSHEDDHRIHG